MRRSPRPARRLSAVILTAVVAVCLAGCETAPPRTVRTAPPTVSLGATGTPEPRPPAPNMAVGALIHRIDMPLDVSLDACWAEVDEQALPQLMHGLWDVNGLRIGVLHADRAGAFAEALPTIHGESRAKLYTSYYPTAVRATPRLMESVPVDLTVPPRSPTVYRAKDGRLQLLVRIGRSETGLTFVEVTPHHYKAKAELVPRSPLEKQLDGRVFRELSALLPIEPDTAIVIGLNRPWPQTPDTPPDEDTAEVEPVDASADTPAPEARDAKPTAPPLPNHLGRALMTGMRAGRETQIMLVISMIEETASPADEAASE